MAPLLIPTVFGGPAELSWDSLEVAEWYQVSQVEPTHLQLYSSFDDPVLPTRVIRLDPGVVSGIWILNAYGRLVRRTSR